MTNTLTCETREVSRLVSDLYDIRHNLISMPMSYTYGQTDTLTATQVSEQDWLMPMPDKALETYEADISVTVRAYNADLCREPVTRGVIRHGTQYADDLDLEPYGVRAQGVLRAILGGGYSVDRLDDKDGGTAIILRCFGLPDLVALAANGTSWLPAHSVHIQPLDPGMYTRDRGGYGFRDDYQMLIHLTINGHTVGDTPDGSTTLDQAVKHCLQDRHPVLYPLSLTEDPMTELPALSPDWYVDKCWPVDTIIDKASASLGTGWDLRVSAWIVMVSRPATYDPDTYYSQYYTLVHASGKRWDKGTAATVAEHWTINQRLSKAQFRAVYPLLKNGLSITTTK